MVDQHRLCLDAGIFVIFLIAYYTWIRSILSHENRIIISWLSILSNTYTWYIKVVCAKMLASLLCFWILSMLSKWIIVNIHLNRGINRGLRSYARNLGSCEYKAWIKLDINGIWTHVLCNTNAFLWQQSYRSAESWSCCELDTRCTLVDSVQMQENVCCVKNWEIMAYFN